MESEHFPIINRLHTDVLQDKYWPIVADVLRHDNVLEIQTGSERIREARLVDKENILRTYALTFLTYDKNNKEIVAIDEQIRWWWLIWDTFRKHWYTIKKNVIDVFIMDIPEWMKVDFKVEWNQAKSRLTEFYAKSAVTNPVIYWIVLEIYSPDFKNPEDGINEIDFNQINPSTGTLQDSWIPTDEIRERLDRAAEINEWNDVKERYEQAKKLSKSVVASLHKKITKYFSNK
jgi:hypothetical protein